MARLHIDIPKVAVDRIKQIAKSEGIKNLSVIAGELMWQQLALYDANESLRINITDRLKGKLHG